MTDQTTCDRLKTYLKSLINASTVFNVTEKDLLVALIDSPQFQTLMMQAQDGLESEVSGCWKRFVKLFKRSSPAVPPVTPPSSPAAVPVPPPLNVESAAQPLLIAGQTSLKFPDGTAITIPTVHVDGKVDLLASLNNYWNSTLGHDINGAPALSMHTPGITVSPTTRQPMVQVTVSHVVPTTPTAKEPTSTTDDAVPKPE